MLLYKCIHVCNRGNLIFAEYIKLQFRQTLWQKKYKKILIAYKSININVSKFY